jgi:8-oxo-dGTP pyrophosphatase MutT (NUDIX family)
MTGIPIPSAGVIVINNGQVLLIKHSKSARLAGIFGLPAGHIDPGESEITAAARELKEETGIIVDVANLIPVKKYVHEIPFEDGQKLMSYQVFLNEDNFDGELTSSEEGTAVWIDLDKVKKLPLLPNVFDAIQTALKLV